MHMIIFMALVCAARLPPRIYGVYVFLIFAYRKKKWMKGKGRWTSWTLNRRDRGDQPSSAILILQEETEIQRSRWLQDSKRPSYRRSNFDLLTREPFLHHCAEGVPLFPHPSFWSERWRKRKCVYCSLRQQEMGTFFGSNPCSAMYNSHRIA